MRKGTLTVWTRTDF